MISFPLRHVRTRLTLWYVALLGAVLLVSWGVVGALLFVQLRGQIDHDAVEDIETVEGLLFYDNAGHLSLHEDYHNHPESKKVLDWLLEVRSPDGAVLYRNERLGKRSLGGDPFRGEGVGGYSVRSARLSDGTEVRLASRQHSLDGHTLILRLAYSEAGIWTRMKELAGAAAIGLPFALAIAGFVGYWLARRALAPVEQMAQQAERITAGQLQKRLPVGTADDELAHLARVFNDLLHRLEQSFEQLRRFTSDASHELRTPLALIRSVGEVGLQKTASAEEYRETIGSMLEEVNRLTALVENLLLIARADAGQLALQHSVFGAMAVAREAAGLIDVLIEDKKQRLIFEGDETATVEGDRVFLRQAILNIIHNAVKFSPAGGAITVRVERKYAPERVSLEIADTGPGIAPEDAARVFDRFYRSSYSAQNSANGVGLGLSIARWAVEANGGEIQVRSLGAGCVFRILLPKATIITET